MQIPPGPQSPTGVADDGFRERLAQYDTPEAANRALLALDAGHIGSWSWDMTEKQVSGDRLMAGFFGLDYDAQPWGQDDVFGTIHPEDLQPMLADVQSAIDENTVFTSEFREPLTDPLTGAQTYRWLSGRGNVTERDAQGNPTRMIVVNWDITAQKQREEQSALMAAEMDHRVKNAFALIRALINLGLRADGTKETFADGLRRQLEAMASAHVISAKLARDSDMPDAPVPVNALFEVALAPWTQDGINPDCTVDLQSDPSFMIHPRLAGSLSMMIYELTTNAAKYGALGVRGGILTIKITKGTGDTIRMDWDEDCGKLPLKPLVETGFGSRLIAQCVCMLGGVIHHENRESGLSLALTINTPRSEHQALARAPVGS